MFDKAVTSAAGAAIFGCDINRALGTVERFIMYLDPLRLSDEDAGTVMMGSTLT
jgi:hypothetical protein